MAELIAMEQFLELMEQNNCQNVIVKVIYEIIINLVKRISCGTDLEKVSKQWSLIQVYQQIQLHLLGLCIVSFNHV